MSRFADLWNDARADIDATFAERLRIAPMQPGNQYTGSGGADPARPATIVLGLLKFGSAEQSAAGDRRNIDFVGRLATGEIGASVALDQIGGLTLRKGDRVTALDRTADRDFEIDQITDDGTRALMLKLIRIDVPEEITP